MKVEVYLHREKQAMSSIPRLKSLVLLFPVALTAHLVLVGAAETGQATIGIFLKGDNIPSNGSGVVNFDDIGGFLGPPEGLLCIVDQNFIQWTGYSYWVKPNGTKVLYAPQCYGEFCMNYDCLFDHLGIALYYTSTLGIMPKERGLFKCVITTDTSILSLNASVHVVDMEVSDLALVGSGPNGPVIAGDNVTISFNITTTPDDAPIPYQWRRNNVNLELNDSTYQGIQTNELTITNVQARHQGRYTCQVAHSASGITKSVTLSVITITVQLTNSPTTNDTKIGKYFMLTCDVHVLGDDTHQGLATYAWFKDGGQIATMEENKTVYTFSQLKFGDAGHYKCQVAMTFGERTVTYESNDFPLTISMVTYQIYLELAKDQICSDWTEMDINDKVKSIVNKICTGVTETCKSVPPNICNFIKNDSHHGYRCPNKVPHTVYYEVTFQGIPEGNTTYFIDCLDEWINSNTDGISVNGVRLRIDKSCSQVLDKQNTPECSHGSTFTMVHGLGIGLGVSGVVIIVLIAAIMVICYKRRPHPDYDNIR